MEHSYIDEKKQYSLDALEKIRYINTLILSNHPLKMHQFSQMVMVDEPVYLDCPFNSSVEDLNNSLRQENSSIVDIDKNVFESLDKVDDDFSFILYKYFYNKKSFIIHEIQSNAKCVDEDFYKLLPVLYFSAFLEGDYNSEVFHSLDSPLIENDTSSLLFIHKRLSKESEFFINITFSVSSLSSFAIHGIRNLVLGIIHLVREDSHYLNSVLKSTLSAKKIAEKEQKRLQLFQDEVDNYAHNIFNVMPDIINGFDLLKQECLLQMPSSITDRIDIELKRMKLLMIFFKIIGGMKIKEIENKTVCDMLFLLENLDDSYKKADFDKKNIKDIDYVPSSDKKANDTLNVIWNLWHNARKYCKLSSFSIKAFELDGELALLFENVGSSLQEHNCNFLLGTVEYPLSLRRNKSGLAIARRKIYELGWKVVSATTCPYPLNPTWYVNQIVVLTSK